jgi:hypothetical protein
VNTVFIERIEKGVTVPERTFDIPDAIDQRVVTWAEENNVSVQIVVLNILVRFIELHDSTPKETDEEIDARIDAQYPIRERPKLDREAIRAMVERAKASAARLAKYERSEPTESGEEK